MANILIIDDSPEARLLLKMLVSRCGHQVVEAANGREALQHCLQHDIHMAICDFDMPVMDGRDFLVEIQKHRPDLPVVIITAHFAAGRINWKQLGAVDFFQKPVPVFELKKSIEQNVNSAA